MHSWASRCFESVDPGDHVNPKIGGPLPCATIIPAKVCEPINSSFGPQEKDFVLGAAEMSEVRAGRVS